MDLMNHREDPSDGSFAGNEQSNDVSHVSMADEEIESVAGLTTNFAIRPSIDIMNNSHEHMHVSMAMITYLTNRIYVSMACNDSQRRRSQMSMARERVEPARSFAVQNIIHEVDRHHDDQPWTHACVHGRIDRSRRSDPCVMAVIIDITRLLLCVHGSQESRT
jgi:hypothetical protein